MPELGPDDATLTLRTARAGMAARAGHDLVIEARRWRATLELDQGAPTQLRTWIDAGSLEVVEGTGGVKPLTDADRAEIGRTIAAKVLDVARHPEITFASSAVVPAPGGGWRIAGRLTLVGVTNPLEISVTARPGPDATRLDAETVVRQSSFGIRPYTAMMGALKVADAVAVSASATVSPG